MGAPLNNVNSVKHGQRSKRHGLVHAKLGRRFANAYGHANQLRKAIEALLKERQGGLSLLEQARLQSIVRLEESIRCLEKTIAESPEMDAAEVRAQRSMVSQWSMQRDNLLASLLGDAGNSPSDPWLALDTSRRSAASPPSPCDTTLLDAQQAPPQPTAVGPATVDGPATVSSPSDAAAGQQRIQE